MNKYLKYISFCSCCDLNFKCMICPNNCLIKDLGKRKNEELQKKCIRLLRNMAQNYKNYLLLQKQKKFMKL